MDHVFAMLLGEAAVSVPGRCRRERGHAKAGFDLRTGLLNPKP